MKGSSRWLAQSQLLQPEECPLLYGLFGDLGTPLLLLSDAIELQSPILVVESLVLAAVDWNGAIADILTLPQVRAAPPEALAPEVIIGRIAYDARFSGLMRSGPGFEHAGSVLLNSTAAAAIAGYVYQLDMADHPRLLDQLSNLSVLLLCGAHKKDQPAFDFYLSTLPSLVWGLHVLLQEFDDERYRAVLIRGVWLLMVMSYITQLRPILDASLVSGAGTDEASGNWDGLFAEFRGQGEAVAGGCRDVHLLRALRSIGELGRRASADGEAFCLRAAWKLRSEWQSWVGLGNAREETLNIRL